MWKFRELLIQIAPQNVTSDFDIRKNCFLVWVSYFIPKPMSIKFGETHKADPDT